MKKINKTKSKLLKAFDRPEKQTIANACRIADVVPSTFYYHLYKDSDFRRQVLERRREYLTATINEGEQ